MDNEISLPITFNPYKHHLKFLLFQIEKWQKNNIVELNKELLTIGNNLLDLYTGSLSVHAVYEECSYFFRQNKIIDKTIFISWLKPKGFKRISLSDNSEWLIKEGADPLRYIHIHPAKNSIFSIRARATTLKTVIALLVMKHSVDQDLKQNLLKVNDVRVEILGLSPVKTLNINKGILHLWKYFEEFENS